MLNNSMSGRPLLKDIFSPNHYEKLKDWSGEKIAWEFIRHHTPYKELYDKYRRLDPIAQNCEYNGSKKVIPDSMLMDSFLSKGKRKLTDKVKKMTYGEYCDKYAKGERVKLKCKYYTELRKYKIRGFFDYNLTYEEIFLSMSNVVRIFTPPHIIDPSGLYGRKFVKIKKNEILISIDLTLELTDQFKSAQAFLKEIVNELKLDGENVKRNKNYVDKPLIVSKARFSDYEIGKALRFLKARFFDYSNAEIANEWADCSFRLESKYMERIAGSFESEVPKEINKANAFLPDSKTGKFRELLMLSIVTKSAVNKISR